MRFGKGVAAFAFIESAELRFPVDNFEIDIGELSTSGEWEFEGCLQFSRPLRLDKLHYRTV